MNMGLSDSIGGSQVIFKRKFRWLFTIPEIASDGTYALPHLRGSRPTFTFKEYGVQHLTEEIFFPMKAEWKPINLTLYDIGRNIHPVIEWISMVCKINEDHKWYPSIPGQPSSIISGNFKKTATLELFDGCGGVMERWKIENCWPQSVDFTELDMASSEVVLVNVTLRYDRATWEKGCS